jgi:murein DD-endopeptidase MepM/ murein hydrolase activator NlpD
MSSSKTGIFIMSFFVLLSSFLFLNYSGNGHNDADSRDYEITLQSASASTHLEFTGIVKKNETIYDIFKKNGLELKDITAVYRSSLNIFNLKKIRPGRSYILIADTDKRIRELRYAVSDHSYLTIKRTQDGIDSAIKEIAYERKIGFITGIIRDNLIAALGANSEYVRIAYDLSDIFAWDIDFTTDIRKGDRFKIVVEELWLGSVFKGFGDVIAVEFINNGRTYEAFRFKSEYYDFDGRSLKKTLLRAPLTFRYISSKYSKRRLHPVLKRYRPHLGVDYVAPSGTPVSASGDGSVIFAGIRGQNGKLVVIKHNAGYTTYYGHLKGFARKIRKGAYVKQGQVIGYVGRTGLATGPHLDYRIKRNGKFVNPLTVSLPRSSIVPQRHRNDFAELSVTMRAQLDGLGAYDFTVISARDDSV